MSDGGGIPPPKDAQAAVKAGVTPSQFPFIVAVAFLLVLATVIGSHWPAFTGNSPTPPVTETPQRLTAAPSETASIPIMAPAPISTSAAADLATRLGGIEARLAAVELGLARAGDRETQLALQSRMTRLESESSGEALRRAGVVLALATLARSASEPSAFKPQFDAMAALAPGDAAVAALRPYAETGVPTRVILAARFPDAAREALDAERIALSGEGILGRVWSSLTGLIRVRRVGDTSGITSADKLARAEMRLAGGELAAAISEVRALEGEAQTKMAPWLRDSEARLSVENAIAGMETRIVNALTTARP
jgi:hypothetical protein